MEKNNSNDYSELRRYPPITLSVFEECILLRLMNIDLDSQVEKGLLGVF